MRPGLLCPGSFGQVQQPQAPLHASMRPGLLCPGRSARPVNRHQGHGFNEAGAVMPRKRDARIPRAYLWRASMRPGLLCPGRGQRRPQALAPAGFNEAGAVMPRKMGQASKQ